MITKEAAIDSLAQTIYYCRAIVFTLDVPHWDAIGLHLRRDYRQLAQEVMETLRPYSPETDDLFQQRTSGATTTSVNKNYLKRSYHEPGLDDLFQQVTTVARGEAARVLARISPEEPWGADVRSDMKRGAVGFDAS